MKSGWDKTHSMDPWAFEKDIILEIPLNNVENLMEDFFTNTDGEDDCS